MTCAQRSTRCMQARTVCHSDCVVSSEVGNSDVLSPRPPGKEPARHPTLTDAVLAVGCDPPVGCRWHVQSVRFIAANSGPSAGLPRSLGRLARSLGSPAPRAARIRLRPQWLGVKKLPVVKGLLCPIDRGERRLILRELSSNNQRPLSLAQRSIGPPGRAVHTDPKRN